jgi:glutamyl-tRNA reductase
MNDHLRETRSMPVSLLIAGRPCLVVGGGQVALRKTGHLLDAGAVVHVVSPDLCEQMEELAASGDIQHIRRGFDPEDVESAVLVFAATNDRYVNRQILDACRQRHVLCSCVDGNWAESDFTTPAIARHGDLTLTVSTGGQSCRQSKMVKNSLAKHLQMVESAELVVVGTDHHHLSVDEREPFHLTGHRLERTGFMMMQLWGVHEFMILNTCNRVEVIAMVSKETSRNGILRHILGFDRLAENQFYIKRGAQAYEHLSLVTSGMLSQTPGETHVAAQMKAALEAAQEAGWAGNMMQEWVSFLLHLSKHIQTEIAPLFRCEEIEELAVDFLQTVCPDFSNNTLMVLGAGMIGQGVVRNAIERCDQIVWCYHKNCPDLPDEWKSKVKLCSFNSIKDRLGEADAVICAVDAPGHLLHSGHAPFFDQEKPVVLIDLGMPRNIDPALRQIGSELQLVDLDGLKQWHQSEVEEQEEVFGKCRALIADHMEQYERISNSFQSGHAK